MLEINSLNFSYGKKQVLYDISLSIPKGSFTAVTGLNGSGKSTLLSCIACHKDFDGSVCLDGIDLCGLIPRERGKRLSYLPQQVKSVPFTSLELISLGRNPYGSVKSEEKMLAEKAMQEIGIQHLSYKKINEISGGERQLCYFAMLVCQNADVMLLDEPASGMDIGREDKIYSVAKQKCQKEGKTVIAVMHNLSNAIKFADNIVIMEKGKAVFFGSHNDCLDKNVFEKHFGVKKYLCKSEAGEEIFFSV